MVVISCPKAIFVFGICFFVNAVFGQYTYPLVTDNCTVPFVNYTSAQVNDILTVAPTAFAGAVASGELSESCYTLMLNVLSTSCLNELYILQGCCSTACGAALNAAYLPCFQQLSNVMCGTGDPTAIDITFNTALRCMTVINGVEPTCESFLAPSPPPPASSPPPGSITYVYPAVISGNQACPYGNSVDYSNGSAISAQVVSALTEAEAANALTLCDAPLLETTINTCSSEILVQNGCCQKTCAEGFAEISDVCYQQIATYICKNDPFLFSVMSNIVMRCISGAASTCSGGVVESLSTLTLPPPSPPPYVYPAVNFTDGTIITEETCTYEPSYYSNTITSRELQNFIFILQSTYPSCNTDGQLNGLIFCSDDVNIEEGCCDYHCATYLAQYITPECAVASLSYACKETDLSYFPQLANTFKRCILGHDPICYPNGTASLNITNDASRPLMAHAWSYILLLTLAMLGIVAMY